MKFAKSWAKQVKWSELQEWQKNNNIVLPAKGLGCPLDRFPLATITEQRLRRWLAEFGWASGMWTISPYLAMLAASPRLPAYLCNFKELRDSRHPREEFLVNVKSFFALHFLHVKVFLWKDKGQSNHCHVLVFLHGLCLIPILILPATTCLSRNQYTVNNSCYCKPDLLRCSQGNLVMTETACSSY